MIDVFDIKEVYRISNEIIDLAKSYKASRDAYAEAKLFLDYNIAKNMSEFRQKRANIGYEMALLMLLEQDSPEIKENYQTYIIQENQFKGLERLIEAYNSKISLTQSLIKHKAVNEL
jgi:hypothetical protein